MHGCTAGLANCSGQICPKRYGDTKLTRRLCDAGHPSSAAAAPPPKRVALIRHGEGQHQPAPLERGVLTWFSGVMQKDARLTPTGRRQAEHLRQQVKSSPSHPLREVEVVISSPLSRAVETALIVFGRRAATPESSASADAGGRRSCSSSSSPAQPRFCVSPHCTECCIIPSDCGRSPTELVASFPDLKGWEGFDALEQEWWPRAKGRTVAQEWRPQDRVAVLKDMLRERQESTIAVVGHGGIFAILGGRLLGNCDVLWIDLHSDGGVSVAGQGAARKSISTDAVGNASRKGPDMQPSQHRSITAPAAAALGDCPPLTPTSPLGEEPYPPAPP